MKKTLQQFIEKMTGSDKFVDESTRAAFADWASLPEPDLLASHYLTRYVVLGSAHQQVYGCVVEENCLSIASTVVFDTTQAHAFSVAQHFVSFLEKSPLVVFRADRMSAFLAKTLPAPWDTPEGLGPCLDLAVLLPELFADGPGPNALLSDWLSYFELPTERLGASDEAFASARLFLCVLAKSAQQGASTPADLLKLQKARRWLWAH